MTPISTALRRAYAAAKAKTDFLAAWGDESEEAKNVLAADLAAAIEHEMTCAIAIAQYDAEQADRREDTEQLPLFG